MPASDLQVQQFSDQRIRPICERIRAVEALATDIIASIDDVYAVLNVAEPTWSDGRTDGPPHLLNATDVLSINTFLHDIRDAIVGNAQWPIVQKACVGSIL